MKMENFFSVEGGNSYSLTNDFVYKFELNFKEGKTGALGNEYVNMCTFTHTYTQTTLQKIC